MAESLAVDNLDGLDLAVGDAPAGVPEIPEARIADPTAYAQAAREILNQALRMEISGLDAKRIRDILNEACEENTGMNIRDAGRQSLDPVERFIGLMETPLEELQVVKEAMAKIDDLRLSIEKKKRYSALIDDVISMQRQAREDPCKFWVYVGRDSEAIYQAAEDRFGVFDMQWFHVDMFRIWNDKKNRYSLIEAPPGHAKSTNLRGYAAWRIGEKPKLRVLLLADADAKANKEVLTLMRVVDSARYKAVFPKIKMLGRTDMVQQSSRGFTLASMDGDRADFNIFSREPTVEGYAIGSQINGSGYDMILADDIVKPECRTQDWERNDTNRRWEDVGRQRLRNLHIAEIKIIATPWHVDDVYGRIERQQRDGITNRWTVTKYAILEDEDGHEIPIWPTRCTQEMLEYEKATSPNPERYACLFRLDPSRSTTRLVKKMHFYHSLPDDELTIEHDKKLFEALKVSERWLSVDPSGSSSKDSADNGVIDASITHNGFGFVTEALSLRMAPVAFKDWVVDRIESGDPPYSGVQIEGQGAMAGHAELFLDDLRKMLAEQGVGEHMTLIVSNSRVGNQRQNISKRLRLQDSAWLIESGRVRFAGHRYRQPVGDGMSCRAIPGSGMALLQNAVLNFDTAGNKDVVDALTQWLLQNRQRLAAAKPEAEKAQVECIDEMTRLFRAQIKKAREPEIDRYDEELAFMVAM